MIQWEMCQVTINLNIFYHFEWTSDTTPVYIEILSRFYTYNLYVHINLKVIQQHEIWPWTVTDLDYRETWMWNATRHLVVVHISSITVSQVVQKLGWDKKSGQMWVYITAYITDVIHKLYYCTHILLQCNTRTLLIQYTIIGDVERKYYLLRTQASPMLWCTGSIFISARQTYFPEMITGAHVQIYILPVLVGDIDPALPP